MPDDAKAERPTLPDLEVFDCPKCRGEDGRPRGYVLVTTESGSGHRSRLQSCDVCWGKKVIDRQALERYAARQGRRGGGSTG